MARKFIATVLAASIAVTAMGATSAQAHHKNDDLIKFLGAATTMIIIGNALKNHNSNGHNGKVYIHSPNHKPKGHGHKTYKPAPKKKPSLPAKCVRNAKGKHGNTYKVLGRHCMSNNYKAMNRVPQKCAVQYRSTNGHIRNGFGIQCLKNHGFRF